MEGHVPIQRSALVEVGVEYSAVYYMSGRILQNRPKLSLDIGISQSDCSVHVVGSLVRFYLMKEDDG